MKEFIQLFLVSILVACGRPSQDVVRFAGTIANIQADSLYITNTDYRKSVGLTSDGSFEDTLNVKKGYYTLSVGDKEVNIFLKNGYDLHISANTDQFYRSLSFRGRGADNNNFIAQRVRLIEYEIGRPHQYFMLDSQAFKAKMDTLQQQLLGLFEGKQLDSVLVAREKAINERWLNYLITNYSQQHEIYSKIQPGKPAPGFTNFENYNGGLTSFEDLPRQFLYIMVWSTNCEACLDKLQAFNNLHNQYVGKGITFVGISTDPRERHEEWEEMVTEEELQGIQLHSSEGLYRPFFRNYNITAPPRYLLINPQREIVTAFAPSPTDSKLQDLFKQLGL